MNQILFDKAKLEDSLRISILLKTVYIQVYGVEGVTHEFANFIDEKFSKKSIEKTLETNPEQLQIAYLKGNPIGVSEILFNSLCPIRKIQLPELGKLYVLERFKGRGIGYGLLSNTEKLVIQKGFDQLNLEVYIKNEGAISFYKRQGYEVIGKVDFPMEQNTYENLVMTKKLN
ncbi:MAG: GNAT family N-acetyltransferase [Bacteroidota bacterium]